MAAKRGRRNSRRRVRRHSGRGGTRSELKRALNGSRLLHTVLMGLEGAALYTIPMTVVGAKGPIAMLFSSMLVFAAGVMQRDALLQGLAIAYPVLHGMYIWGNAPVRSITGRYVWRFDPNARIPAGSEGSVLTDAVTMPHPATGEPLVVHRPTDLPAPMPADPAPLAVLQERNVAPAGAVSDYVQQGQRTKIAGRVESASAGFHTGPVAMAV